ncbi:MarR family transcriptional regulator [Sinomonas sp. R1AF57]|nr:MarR family transcriptional regulator [Sinomonas sp. R1AF57]
MMDHMRATAPDLSTVPGELGWNLAMVLRGYQARFESAIGDAPGGVRGFQILSAVVHHDLPNQQALGAHLAIDRTVLTYLLDGLADAGLIERIPAAGDRRARKVVATGEGRAQLARLEERVAAAEAALLAGFPADDGAALRALLARLARAVHAADPGADPCEAVASC